MGLEHLDFEEITPHPKALRYASVAPAAPQPGIFKGTLLILECSHTPQTKSMPPNPKPPYTVALNVFIIMILFLLKFYFPDCQLLNSGDDPGTIHPGLIRACHGFYHNLHVHLCCGKVVHCVKIDSYDGLIKS